MKSIVVALIGLIFICLLTRDISVTEVTLTYPTSVLVNATFMLINQATETELDINGDGNLTKFTFNSSATSTYIQFATELNTTFFYVTNITGTTSTILNTVESPNNLTLTITSTISSNVTTNTSSTTNNNAIIPETTVTKTVTIPAQVVLTNTYITETVFQTVTSIIPQETAFVYTGVVSVLKHLNLPPVRPRAGYHHYGGYDYDYNRRHY